MFANVSKIGTRQKMSWACFWKLIMWVQNESPVGDCSRRPDHPHKMPGCQVAALSSVRPNHHKQRNGEQQGWEQSKLGCTVRKANAVSGHGLDWQHTHRITSVDNLPMWSAQIGRLWLLPVLSGSRLTDPKHPTTAPADLTPPDAWLASWSEHMLPHHITAHTTIMVKSNLTQSSKTHTHTHTNKPFSISSSRRTKVIQLHRSLFFLLPPRLCQSTLYYPHILS